jgi:ovo-like protein
LTGDDIFGESSSRFGRSSPVVRNEEQRRFKSSILGGDIPYGSGSLKFLTQAQRKEYPPTLPIGESRGKDEGTLIREPANILPEENLINLSQKKVEEPEQPAVVRCSVIQRVPSKSVSPALSTNPSPSPIVHYQREPRSESVHIAPLPQPVTSSHPVILRNITPQPHQMHYPQRLHHPIALQPEQEHPIDYHVPKKRDLVSPIKRSNKDGDKIGNEEEEDKKMKRYDTIEERDRRFRDAKRAVVHRLLLHQIRKMQPGHPMLRRLAGIFHAAAGHGRSSSSNNGGQAANGSNGTSSSNNSSGASINFTSGGCGTSGAGATGGKLKYL